tara:strand:+ start:228 stop:875 length:648 start_codon:yes stop_codon:yes gene_type:complete
MKVSKVIPPVSSFLRVELDKEIIDYLWKIIKISKSKNVTIKDRLIGNISKSLILEDTDSYFYSKVCIPLVNIYREQSMGVGDPIQKNALLNPKTQLLMNSFWVNYQYQNEFNPYHDHNGVYSFAIWLKIPYDWNELKKLPQFEHMQEENIKAGNFEFEYNDTLGTVKNYYYRLSKKVEGTMLFFPARLRHCVYPFYGTDEPRISIAGNLSYYPKI